MTAWGTIQLGRLTLRETWSADDKVNASTGVRDLALTGQESMPPLTLAAVRQRAEDIGGLMERLVPATFTGKPQFDGYYRIKDVGVQVDAYGDVERAGWNLTLSRIGADGAVDLESRLAHIARLADPTITTVPERWHVPPGAAYAYHAGATTPAVLIRDSADGPLTVYRDIEDGSNPRWSCPVEGYGIGRVRVLVDGAERTPAHLATPPHGWQLENGLVRVTTGGTLGGAATLIVSNFDGAGWDAKAWNLSIGSAGAADAVTGWDAATILRNDYEACTVRLVIDRVPGRAILDLTLRRGSRFVEGYLQTPAATTLALWPNVDEASSAFATSGYLRATNNDADGNRYVIGSARTWTARLASSGGFYRTATPTLDFFAGSAVGGSGAATGDGPQSLIAQYLGALPEQVTAVAR